MRRSRSYKIGSIGNDASASEVRGDVSRLVGYSFSLSSLLLSPSSKECVFFYTSCEAKCPSRVSFIYFREPCFLLLLFIVLLLCVISLA